MEHDRTISLPELALMLGVDESRLLEWARNGLLQPLRQSGPDEVIFALSQAECARHIYRLANMGYHETEIRRIMRKVGMPGKSLKARASQTRDSLTIGALAERVGVSPRTIKHWEEKGIIDPDMRSEGGFRLYPESFVYLCQLIRDLQLFGYSLEEIKNLSDLFRVFLTLQADPESSAWESADEHFRIMLEEISGLEERMVKLKAGIRRWEGLLSKKSREVVSMQKRNRKRNRRPSGEIR